MLFPNIYLITEISFIQLQKLARHSYELMFKRSLRSRLDVIRPNTENTVLKAQDAQIVHAKGKDRSVEVGDDVLVKDYRKSNNSWTEAKVVKQTGPVSYVVNPNNEPQLNWRRHMDQISGRKSSVLAMPPVPTHIDHDNTSDDTGANQVLSPPHDYSETNLDIQNRYPIRDRKPPDRLQI